MRILTLTLASWGGVLFFGGAPVVSPDGEGDGGLPDLSTPEAFGRHVQPILSEHCYTCHGPDSATREAGLRLDLRAELDASGVVVPGDPDTSELVHRITTDDEWDVMPPPETKDALDERERAILSGWVEAGAPWAEHWAFVAPERPPLPESSEPELGAIDRFVRARLEAEGVAPSAPADPIVLLRRTFLTLTGLPPTLEEIDAFERELAGGADSDALLDAWIDRIFTTEPYATRSAEHRARGWLDAARYADTIGIHTDNSWQAWSYRDWVVDALRDNKPFDDFVVEQLAGDRLPEPTTDQLVATGFHRMHVVTDEGGAINDEYLVEYAVDRVATTGSVLLGLTLGCARCHDHKYDPISAEDFYGLYDFFDGVEQPGLYSQLPGQPTRAFEPFVEVPTPEIEAELAAIDTRLDTVREQADEIAPEELRELETFEADMRGAVAWAPSTLHSVSCADGGVVDLLSDGSANLVGERNHGDVIELDLSVVGEFDTFLFEALPADGQGGSEGVGRADNGNAVIRTLRLDRVRGEERERIPLEWIAANVEQPNSDFAALNALDDGPHVWAFDAHNVGGDRWALVLLDEAVELGPDERLVLTVDSRSPYANHVPARMRATFGLARAGLREQLPTARGRLLRSEGFAFASTDEGYARVYPPERVTALQRGSSIDSEDFGPWTWSFNASFVDDATFALDSGAVEAIVVGRELVAPSPRRVPLSLGSDDGFVLRLDGELVAERRVDRGVAADQDRVTLELAGGRQVLAQKIVNTGGLAGVYQSFELAEGALDRSLLPLAFPDRARETYLADARAAWRRERSPRFREFELRIADLEAERDAALARRPRAMVMRERMEEEPTYVLTRGDYRTPDTTRPVEPALPPVLGRLPEGASRDRLGFAHWVVSDANPLTARVIANRLWAELFGTGLVATTDDLGLQGERPSHPELLDWLAVEFRESGWDVQHMLKLCLSSETWRQASDWRPDLAELDPEDRLLARYPRRRLVAEAVRDQALFAADLLVEDVGGPPVRPYQPDGLWQEVAMLQSNTRTFEQDDGPALWRRSLYTFWKRAAPPPSMLTFDAPTREFCVVERSRTDTPLQALVLMNDVQFVEAARELAERAVGEARELDLSPDDRDAFVLDRIFRRVLTRAPEPGEAERLLAAQAELEQRYAADVVAAEQLLSQGQSGLDGRLDPADLAAWTLVASATLNLFEATDPR